MADKNSKHEKNVAGKFYVDTGCISCGQCVDIASDYFAEDNGMYVKIQPTDVAGENLCQEAVEVCPVEAIGSDGEQFFLEPSFAFCK